METCNSWSERLVAARTCIPYILLGLRKFAYAFAYVPAFAYVYNDYSFRKNLPFSFPERRRKTGPDIRHAQAAHPHTPNKSLIIHH